MDPETGAKIVIVRGLKTRRWIPILNPFRSRKNATQGVPLRVRGSALTTTTDDGVLHG